MIIKKKNKTKINSFLRLKTTTIKTKNKNPKKSNKIKRVKKIKKIIIQTLSKIRPLQKMKPQMNNNKKFPKTKRNLTTDS